MSMKRPFQRRKQTVVDKRYQTRFALQILAIQAIAIFAYQGAIQLRITHHMRNADSFPVEEALSQVLTDTLLTLMIVAPVVAGLMILFSLRLSNRLVGPLPRLHRAMDALSKGHYGTRIVFRPGDAIERVADDFNRLAESLEGRHGQSEPTKPVQENVAASEGVTVPG